MAPPKKKKSKKRGKTIKPNEVPTAKAAKVTPKTTGKVTSKIKSEIVPKVAPAKTTADLEAAKKPPAFVSNLSSNEVPESIYDDLPALIPSNVHYKMVENEDQIKEIDPIYNVEANNFDSDEVEAALILMSMATGRIRALTAVKAKLVLTSTTNTITTATSLISSVLASTPVTATVITPIAVEEDDTSLEIADNLLLSLNNESTESLISQLSDSAEYTRFTSLLEEKLEKLYYDVNSIETRKITSKVVLETNEYIIEEVEESTMPVDDVLANVRKLIKECKQFLFVLEKLENAQKNDTTKSTTTDLTVAKLSKDVASNVEGPNKEKLLENLQLLIFLKIDLEKLKHEETESISTTATDAVEEEKPNYISLNFELDASEENILEDIKSKFLEFLKTFKKEGIKKLECEETNKTLEDTTLTITEIVEEQALPNSVDKKTDKANVIDITDMTDMNDITDVADMTDMAVVADIADEAMEISMENVATAANSTVTTIKTATLTATATPTTTVTAATKTYSVVTFAKIPITEATTSPSTTLTSMPILKFSDQILPKKSILKSSATPTSTTTEITPLTTCLSKNIDDTANQLHKEKNANDIEMDFLMEVLNNLKRENVESRSFITDNPNVTNPIVLKEITKNYEIGDMFWAQMSTFSYWPCLIFPNKKGDFLLEIGPPYKKKIVVHVKVFDAKATKCWIEDENLIPYVGVDKYMKMSKNPSQHFGRSSFDNQQYKSKAVIRKWDVAVQVAEIFYWMSKEERMLKYVNYFANVIAAAEHDINASF